MFFPNLVYFGSNDGDEAFAFDKFNNMFSKKEYSPHRYCLVNSAVCYHFGKNIFKIKYLKIA